MNECVLIPLTKGMFARVDAEDAELVLAFKWCAAPGTRTTYAARAFRREDGSQTTQSMHRLLTGFEVTDHINGDGLDNRRSNLREATYSQNNRNARMRSHNTSGFKGVSWCKRSGKWRANIFVDGKQLHLGLHARLEDAARSYDAAARTHFGSFATLNFPRAGERPAITKAS